MLPDLPKIILLGATGSGKSTLGQSLSSRLGIPHIELDALHWGPRWTPVPEERLRQQVSDALRYSAWIIDGNYSKTHDLTWPQATTFIWLDYPYPLLLYRLLRRTLRRAITKEKLWHGNTEPFWPHLKIWSQKDSLFVWQIHSVRKHRRDYPGLLAAQKQAQVLRFRHPKETATWLDALPPTPLHPAAAEGIRLFNQGDYFTAHEALEDAWRDTNHPLRDLYRGILQISVACLHLQRGNRRGALLVRDRSRKWLDKWPPVTVGVHVRALQNDLDALLQASAPPARWPQVTLESPDAR